MLTVILFTLFLSTLFAFWILNKKSSSPVSFSWTVPEQANVGWLGDQFHSDIKDAQNPDKIISYDPATGSLLSIFPSLTSQQVTSAIDKAVIASEKWKLSTFDQRKDVLRSLLHWILNNQADIARLCCRDSGKTMLDASLGEILVTIEKIRWTLANGENCLKPDYRSNHLMTMHKHSYVTYEPLGVVAALVSWNYPFHNMLGPIISAIMSGNAIIVKASEQVAFSSSHFAKAVRSCLEACGHSPEIVQVLIACEANATQALLKDERISHITFIGSEPVGRLVAQAAGSAGTAVCLELGGKDACILTASADISFFTNTFVRGVFQSAGQNCIGIERFIVHEDIYDHFVSTMEPRVRSLQIGASLNATTGERVDVGALISSRPIANLERLISKAVADGARLLIGGHRFKHPQFPFGSYFEPTLLVDVNPESEIASTELFAPVMLVIKAKDTSEAVKIANSTRYALGASVFGRNHSECRDIASKLHCGMCSINDFAVFYVNQGLPFGGAKSSGFGRFAGQEGLRALCNVKAICEDRLPNIIQTSIPPLLAYPIEAPERSWQFIQGMLRMIYEPSWTHSVRHGLVEMLQSLRK